MIAVFFAFGLTVIATVIALAVIFEVDNDDRFPHP